jgi:sterol desaturase/sphingolipid hydroxylase (fatty acid hydroxylase superfamily)
MIAKAFGLIIALLVLGVLLSTLEHIAPANKNQSRWRHDMAVDVRYWFFTAIVTKLMTKVAMVGAFLGISLFLGRHLNASLLAGFPPINTQPRWLMVMEVLLIGDLIGYFMHRAFHRGRLWKFHAIHHSSQELDWLSSVRLHPVNELITRITQIAPLAILGFPVNILAFYAPFLTFYAILIHANVNWSFGPLRYVIATPLFHRWHHTSEKEGLDKNFAGLFPIWDILFGTFHMPDNKVPEKFGVRHETIPEGLMAQLAYPFQ